ncbi:MAG: ArsA family ATPase, partial [Dermatophilaceae bacterium]
MPSPDLTSRLEGVRLHVVTGKGGVGKTTVAGALALALTRQGRQVLLIEVENRQGISQLFDVPPLGTAEARLVSDDSGGELWGLSIDAKAALLEYLQTFYRLGRAGGALERLGVVDFATTIAPGVRDVLLTGKIYEAVTRTSGRRRGRGGLVWDAVVLDAPPTGRVARFLNVNTEVAGLARVGPIHSQAQAITGMLTDGRSVVHLVTLLEEMPVQETADAVADLGASGIRLGAVVVNQVREPLVDERALA